MPDQKAFALDGVNSECWLLRFDKDGQCESPDTRAQLLDALRARDPCRVILISHGWNNDFGNAVDLYARFIQHFETLASKTALDPKAIVVGIIWPSSWAPSDKGPVIAALPGGPSNDPADPARMLLQSLTDDSARVRVAALLARPALDQNDAAELAVHVAAALADESPGNGDGTAESSPGDADILAAMRALSNSGTRGTVSDDWTNQPSPPKHGTGVGDPSAAGLFGIDPLMAVRVFTVYQMKDRAGRVGASGIATLLEDLLAQTSHTIHCVGHSYGCKVLLSAVCKAATPARPVESMLLLEPAISHLCFAATVPGRPGSGGYRSALSEVHVVQPIFSTYSRWDVPLHTIFHLALRRQADLGELQVAAAEGTSAGVPPSIYCALGGYGPRNSGEALIDPLPGAGEDYDLPPGHRVYAFDGTLDKRISGHGDVATELTAWALIQQMKR